MPLITPKSETANNTTISTPNNQKAITLYFQAYEEPLTGVILKELDKLLPGYDRRQLEVRAQAEAKALMQNAAEREKIGDWKDYRETVGHPTGLGERVLRDMAAGGLNASRKIVDTLNLPLDSQAAKIISSELERLSNEVLPGLQSTGDKVAQQVGEGLTFFIPGVGASKFLASMQYVTRNMAAWGGSTTAAFLESSAEAGTTYDELIKNGKPPAEARYEAEKVFWGNMALVGATNKLGMLADSGGMLIRGGKGAAVESLQTFAQLGLSNHATDKNIEEGTASAVVFSLFFGGATAGTRGLLAQHDGASPGGVFQSAQDNVDMIYDQNVKKLDIPSEARNEFREHLHRDPLTGFGVDEDRLITVQRGRQHVALTGQETVYGEIDIANLGGLNHAVPREKADSIFKRITEIVDEELKPVINASGGKIEFFRHGGDEFSFVSTGVNRNELSDALTEARERVNRYIADEGLSDIKHLKHPNDPSKRGVSIAFGTSRIDNNIPAKDSLQYADQQVEKMKKQTHGLVRRQTPEEQRALIPKKEDMLPVPPTREAIAESKKSMNTYWGSLPDTVKNSSRMMKPDEVNRNIFNAKTSDYDLDVRQKSALFREGQYDPVTGFFSRYDRFSTMARAIKNVEKHGTTSTLVSCEIRGLNSLNAAYGASGANEPFKEIANLVKTRLGRPEQTISFRNNGPRFEIIANDVSPAEIEKALSEATLEIAYLARTNGWNKLQHPKYSHFASQDGVGIYAAATPITPGTTPAEMFHANSLKIREKEMNHLHRVITEKPRGE